MADPNRRSLQMLQFLQHRQTEAVQATARGWEEETVAQTEGMALALAAERVEGAPVKKAATALETAPVQEEEREEEDRATVVTMVRAEEVAPGTVRVVMARAMARETVVMAQVLEEQVVQEEEVETRATTMVREEVSFFSISRSPSRPDSGLTFSLDSDEWSLGWSDRYALVSLNFEREHSSRFRFLPQALPTARVAVSPGATPAPACVRCLVPLGVSISGLTSFASCRCRCPSGDHLRDCPRFSIRRKRCHR